MFWNRDKKFKVENIYCGLREQALMVTPADLNIKLDEGHVHQVYAAVVDMPVGGKIATLVCLFDGTVSLYFSDGGGILGAGQKHESIRKASGDFLFSAGQAVPYLSQTMEFPLPTGKEARIYLKCGEGVYVTQFDMGRQQSVREKEFLNFLIQRVLNAFRESGEM